MSISGRARHAIRRAESTLRAKRFCVKGPSSSKRQTLMNSRHISKNRKPDETVYTDAGFVRSWKLNLCLTARAEDNHATLNSSVIHSDVLLRAGHARSVAITMINRCANLLLKLESHQSELKGW